MFKYIFCLSILVILLSQLRENQSELAEERSAIAKKNDELARCKMLSQDESTYTKFEMCRAFTAQDDECKSFPEQKAECKPFLNQSSYVETKYQCSEFQNKSNMCKALVGKELWYGAMLDYKDYAFVQSAFQLIGIDIKQKWFEQITSLNLDIKIAVVAPKETKKEFYQGINIATQEINDAGGVLGRGIKIVSYPAHTDINGSKDIAYNVIENTSFVAVISAQTSEKTKPVTKIYERGGVFNLITSATNMDIINSDMKYTFRMIPNNLVVADKTADYAKKAGYKKIAIITESSAYAEELSNAFYKVAIEKDMSINFFKNFDKNKKSFSDIIGELSERKPEVIYFAGRYNAASKFLIQMRNIGMKTPVIGTESLDAQNFISLVGGAGEGIVIPSIYNEKLESPENSKFSKLYKDKYGINPNSLAVQGYDALKLLAMVMNELQTTIPSEVASIVHFDKDWNGAGGRLTFDKARGIKKEIFFKQLHFGEYQIIDN